MEVRLAMRINSLVLMRKGYDRNVEKCRASNNPEGAIKLLRSLCRSGGLSAPESKLRKYKTEMFPSTNETSAVEEKQNEAQGGRGRGRERGRRQEQIN